MTAIDKMRISGKLTAQVLDNIGPHVRAGVTTNYLNDICHQYITKDLKATPSTLNHGGFPKSVCISVNEEICHTPPSSRVLVDGDIVSIDVVVCKNGYHGDSCKTFLVGKVSRAARKLVRITNRCLEKGLKEIKHGAYLGTIGHVIEKHAKRHNYSIIRAFGGHGIGQEIHQLPSVLNYGERDTGLQLVEGMTIAVEPLLAAGSGEMRILADGYTAITSDGSLSAHAEHTVLVTKTGYEILTSI